jgi:Linalool dehydratase/isomerase
MLGDMGERRDTGTQSRGLRWLRRAVALAAAFVVWLFVLRGFFDRSESLRHPTGVAPDARRLTARQLALWTDPESRERELLRMRGTNAEWDFMGRSFLVWALVNLGLREPEMKPRYLPVIDTIIDETLRVERERTMFHFLMPYARASSFRVEPPRSQFVDGEIALMLAMRRLLAEKPEYAAPLRERLELMVSRMGKSPVLCAESYPNECWTFCNAVGLAALRVGDALDGTDHSEFLARWVATAKERLVDPQTGLLASSYTLDGVVRDGPEGSSLWLVAHALEIVDRQFAIDQYRRSKHALGRSFFGFGWAREWPSSFAGRIDVDSGPVIPLLDVSAGSSGLAFVGAAAFDDRDYYAALTRTLFAGGFPIQTDQKLFFAASNQVGDAVLLYSSVLGPAWSEVERRLAAGRVRSARN